MAVDSATFLDNYPEFAALQFEDVADGTTYVAAVLARAERRISSDISPEALRDDFVMLQAADMLAMSPWGRAARLSEPGKPTAWCEDLERRKKAYGFARSRIVGLE